MWDLHAKLIARTLRNDAAWCDDITTPEKETCAAQLARALDQTLDTLTARYGADVAAWRWGTAHQARHNHPVFSRVALLRDLGDLTIAADGGNDTVNRGAMRVANRAIRSPISTAPAIARSTTWRIPMPRSSASRPANPAIRCRAIIAISSSAGAMGSNGRSPAARPRWPRAAPSC
ncbi:MAG: penicillin acylase family protein [Pseudomonadota bacterium]